MNFKNKVILITGASSGIGAGTAEYLAELGASLAITGRNEENLKQTAEKLNNAGTILTGSIETTKLTDYDSVMNTNIRSTFYITKLAMPHLIATKGNIVNVSSITGIRSFPGILSYCMSKSAMDQFTQCVAIEMAEKGVRVNSVNPGVIVTPLHKRNWMNEEQYEKFLEHCKSTHALGRPGSVSEVASAIAFLACDSTSSFITGVLLPVDGGRQVMCPR